LIWKNAVGQIIGKSLSLQETTLIRDNECQMNFWAKIRHSFGKK